MNCQHALGIVAATLVALGFCFKANAQERIVTFEQLANGQTISPNTAVDADAYPNNGHYFLDDYALPGTPSATISDVGSAQGKVLNLSGGARLYFRPQIGVTNGRFDVSTINGALSYLALDNNLYELDDILSTTGGTLQTGQSRWTYTVNALTSGYSRVAVARNPLGFGASVQPQFAVIGGTIPILVDNVAVSVFPEPTSLAIAAAPVFLLIHRRRRGSGAVKLP